MALMVRKLLIFAVMAGVVGLAAFWVLTIPAQVPASALKPYTPDLANGRVMFYASGCAGCHATPGQEDKTRLGGGLALKTPFGTFYPPNISPDRNDGIGGCSAANFVTAPWKGTPPHARHAHPAFPHTSSPRCAIGHVTAPFP